MGQPFTDFCARLGLEVAEAISEISLYEISIGQLQRRKPMRHFPYFAAWLVEGIDTTESLELLRRPLIVAGRGGDWVRQEPHAIEPLSIF